MVVDATTLVAMLTEPGIVGVFRVSLVLIYTITLTCPRVVSESHIGDL
jgi:hypothetical protein